MTVSASSVLRRALLVWGWGHIHIGDRRGWLLALFQPIAIVTLVFVAVQLIDGTRWLVVFPPLAALIVVWLAQALHAYTRAVELGARRGGEVQAALFLPAAVAVLTAFWLLGGRNGSPAATLESYVIAWMTDRPDAASALYESPPTFTQLDESWRTQFAYLSGRVTTLAAQYGPQSGLDPTSPFDNLRFTDPVSASSTRQVVGVEIVRRQRVENLILGVVPTATQETVVVERAGTITLSLVPEPGMSWLPFGRLDSLAWRIQGVQIGTP
ncbi:MAG: hypothetical protein ABIP53_08690 [Candidatus Limnocylindrales bacterium]